MFSPSLQQPIVIGCNLSCTHCCHSIAMASVARSPLRRSANAIIVAVTVSPRHLRAGRRQQPRNLLILEPEPPRQNQHLLLGGDRFARCARTARTCRQRIDHLAWTRVMQLLAGLMFNRVRVVLQPVDMPLQQVILPLQTMQLAIQGLRILPLLLIYRKPILPEDDVVPHPQREQRSSTRRDFSPGRPTSFIQTHDRTRLLCYGARLARTSHIDLSTNSTILTVKWKSPFAHERT